ncbi:MAG: hypothetical protein GC189_09650 [Alphaproteobacteria bacterium]|nr:hypothetical protein [Alphaproteobacteria bacterium]
MPSAVAYRSIVQAQLDFSRMSNALGSIQRQVSSGNAAQDLAGFGDGAGRLVSAVSARSLNAARLEAIKQVEARFGIQESALNQAANASQDLALALRNAVAANDGRSLETSLSIAFTQITSALNQSYNNQPLFAGERFGPGPIKPQNLDQLKYAQGPGDIFDVSERPQTFDLGFGQPIKLADRASDIAGGAYNALQGLKIAIDAAGGALPNQLTADQRALLEDFARQLEAAASEFSSAEGRTGQLHQALEREGVRLEARNIVFEGAISEQADADIAALSIQLSSLTTQYEASAKVFAQLSRLTLLNYLPIS